MTMRGGRLLSLVLATKLYWGMAFVLVIGALLSPVDGVGGNIFLSLPNLTDVLRQVSITGIIAVGMTFVILSGGIDLSVGSVMALGCTLTAMLLTQDGWHRGALVGTGAASIVAALAVYAGAAKLLAGRLGVMAGVVLGGLAAVSMAAWIAPALAGGLGVVQTVVLVLSVGLLIGAFNGAVVTVGGLQPFIATLATMVAVLGAARLTAGADQSVYPVYTGANAAPTFELLRASMLRVPVPGLIFLAVAAVAGVVLTRFRFGREVYAIGGNEQAARLAGLAVGQTKILVYALSGMLASLAGVLYTAQYRQGKPDAGVGLELDAIAAVVIGGASLAGGKGSIPGALAGVLIFGILTNIFQLCNIDSNAQLVLKGLIIVAAVALQQGRVPRLRRAGGST
ncbi:MAG: ABC transporter permease [Alphaproteobacteria bacterium]|nr:ABC transporter permease [Alphaproteobacteria bacterium]MBU1515192.1 ABC transporter permease [Alphaproteobacteria bacterium]MBU2092322.1 ABC transporter permease [Alphaproteobacteria bacterium]MBU2152916.1 ABC transporter permease [Alphaproteobacteria bacterium]MBU2305747.1 ABC transporter permease [Alphaproteobacteria bacterium]